MSKPNLQSGQSRSLSIGLSRRDFLYVGLAGGLGLSLPDYLQRMAQADQKLPTHKPPVADSIINIFLPGGMAAQESFDPKPLAPIEYRGPLGAVGTVLPGVAFSECLPKTAQIADRLCVIRSMNHGEAAHERGTHNMFTGYRPSPAVSYPSIGSVISHELGNKTELPPYIVLPTQPTEFAGPGFLSTRFGPFSLYSDPADKNFAVRDLSLPGDVDHARFQRRQQMLEAVESHFRAASESDAVSAMDEFYQRAYNILSSESARAAFDLRQEPATLLDNYGRHAAGMRMILCRRLVEAGVRFVSMTFGSWDHHANIAGGVRSQLHEFDQGFSALIQDLDARGMLDRTLVMVTTEFGRSPKINRDGGRDHWPRVFSVVAAGGGFHRGLVYGASDSTATTVDSDPLSVEDFATTIYNQIGIIADGELMAPGNRPIEIVKGGKVVTDLLAKPA
ncbi:MAG: DUF1501 domain-containing protein [Phycisphaerales bacterium]|nr:DUF1501 domain-containing protein [Phycisphaerales bacterium]MCB9854544.1 DUF1501 domain-containing protein [Phycisphaerales bacterium]MCB9863199.1 DUF1501 domain-containing protein [Phycisphaerales bacterium]